MSLRFGVRAGNTTGDDLAALRQKISQAVHVLVINGLDLLRLELADFFAQEFFLDRPFGLFLWFSFEHFFLQF